MVGNSMKTRCFNIVPKALTLLAILSLVAPGCVDSERTDEPSWAGSDPGDALACVQSDAARCAEAPGCRWVGGVGCLSNAELPGAQLPQGFVFDGEYDGTLVPGDALGGGKKQKSKMQVMHYGDGKQVCGEFTFELSVDAESAELYFSVEGRVLRDEIAIALSNPRCVPAGSGTLCERVLGSGESSPEKYLTRAFFQDNRLLFTPALPAREALEHSRPRLDGRALFDLTYMRPHDGFKPSEVSPIKGCGE